MPQSRSEVRKDRRAKCHVSTKIDYLTRMRLKGFSYSAFACPDVVKPCPIFQLLLKDVAIMQISVRTQ